jgi:hypothetical protein
MGSASVQRNCVWLEKVFWRTILGLISGRARLRDKPETFTVAAAARLQETILIRRAIYALVEACSS